MVEWNQNLEYQSLMVIYQAPRVSILSIAFVSSRNRQFLEQKLPPGNGSLAGMSGLYREKP